MALSLNDKELRKTIEAQLLIRFKLDENKKIIDGIKDKKFTKIQMLEMSTKDNVEIKKIKIKSINDKNQFDKNMMEKIYNYSTGDIFILSDIILKENFLVRIVKQTDPQIKNESEDFKKYVNKANAQYIAKIYRSYDKYINSNYKIEVNQKVVERLKNSF